MAELSLAVLLLVMLVEAAANWGLDWAKELGCRVQAGSLTWLRADAGWQLGAQLGLLAEMSTHSLFMWLGIPTIWQLG